jgi:hypothetical protein|tara:strand:+ start:5126 stop:5263 length:138 start_codon:yes stop_codon:yes gene_type:complete
MELLEKPKTVRCKYCNKIYGEKWKVKTKICDNCIKSFRKLAGVRR